MKKYLLLMILFLTGCTVSHVRGAYVQADSSCQYLGSLNSGYTVHLGAPVEFWTQSIQVSGCMSLEDATALAKQINVDLNHKWSAGPETRY